MMILKTSRGALSSGGFDAMAARYLKAVETAGATVTSTQQTAINDFFKTGKSQGWISSLRRMYLPIWGAAAPNAIDMLTIASGTFVGGVTHGSGFVQGNGTTGYFDFGATPSSLGMTTSGGSCFALVNQADSRTDSRFFIGQTDGSNRRVYLSQIAASAISTTLYNASAAVTNSLTSRNGIFLGVINAINDRYLKRRGASGVTYTTFNTTNDTSVASTTRSPFVMANNSNGTSSSFSDARLGAYGLGLGFTSTQGDDFTLALKNLWETSTGLTLP